MTEHVAPAPPKEFKVAEIREDGTIVLALNDGRMFPAAAKENVVVHKNATVRLAPGEFDKEGVPVKPVIASVV
jgi:hypothetical protein